LVVSVAWMLPVNPSCASVSCRPLSIPLMRTTSCSSTPAAGSGAPAHPAIAAADDNMIVANARTSLIDYLHVTVIMLPSATRQTPPDDTTGAIADEVIRYSELR